MVALRATPDDQVEVPRLFAVIQRCWLGMMFLVGLGYIALIPPFQAIDEIAHWDRVWSVAQGQYNCKMIPTSGASFVSMAFRFDADWSRPPTPVPRSVFREMWDHVGSEGAFWIATNGCHYPPVGYLPGALAVKVFTPGAPTEPRPHKHFIAHYGIRLANWIFFFACALYAFRKSSSRAAVLVFLSVPMVLLQAMAINNDAVVLGGGLLAFALLTQEPTRRRLWTAIVIVALLSAVKPIHAIASTLIWAVLREAVQRRVIGRWESVATALAAIALPVLAWLAWNATMDVPILGVTTGMPVGGVDEAAQKALLKAEPIRVLWTLWWQLKQVFTGTPINGGWRGFMLVLGWYRPLVPDYVYEVALLALVPGLFLLRGDAMARRRSIPPLFRSAIYGSILAYFAVVV
ncbi:MAG TPA: DUF2142 domain-containing protein, partial [Polyangiales bacterium]